MKNLFAFIFLFIIASSIAQCPLQGTAKNKNEAIANRLKNRAIIEGTVDTSVTLEKMLAPGEDSKRFNDSSYVKITGYLVAFKKGDKESCNCEESADSLIDTHIFIGKTPYAEKSDCIVVEITPRFKKLHKDLILKAMQGKLVNVCGYPFFDGEHKGFAVNTCNGCKHAWRGSCNEVHPVCEIELVENVKQ